MAPDVGVSWTMRSESGFSVDSSAQQHQTYDLQGQHSTA